MDFEVMKAYLPRFWDALLLTLRIGWQGVALALALGVACAVAVHWKIPVLRQIVGGYIELFRNTPLLVQLFFLYFALPKIGVRISAETCGKLGLGLLGGAYMAETFRSGLENIPIVQTESAQSLGLRPAQVFGYVILPQAVTSSVPGLLANLIFLLNQRVFNHQPDGSDVHRKRFDRHVRQNHRMSDPARDLLPHHASSRVHSGKLAGKEAALCRVWELTFCSKARISCGCWADCG